MPLSCTWAWLDSDATLMCFNNSSANCQSKPTPLCIKTVKGLENPLLLLIWYTGPMVNNLYTQVVVRIFGRNNIFISNIYSINCDNNLSMFRAMVYSVFN